MSAPDIRLGAGKLKDGADIVREAKTKFDRDAGNLGERDPRHGQRLAGPGRSGLPGPRAEVEGPPRGDHPRAQQPRGVLDETERDSVANDANVGENITHFANGLGA